MFARIVVAALLAAVPALADSCTNPTVFGKNCSCDLSALHPLQGAIGFAEARKKAGKIADNPDKALKKLVKDPIKVVEGPDGLYITDHHHTARAWLLNGRSDGVCLVDRKLSSTNIVTFWTVIAGKDHLEDEYGKPITPAQLPGAVADMPDDPYRSLAGLLRKEGSVCRPKDQMEFFEFVWADWMRDKLPRDRVTASPASMLPEARELVRKPEAVQLVGYLKPGAACPSDEDD